MAINSIQLKAAHPLCLVFSYLVCVSASLPFSDAAGHNRVYLRAGLDHLSRHGGKYRRELALNVLSSCWSIKAVMLGGQLNVLHTCYTWLCFKCEVIITLFVGLRGVYEGLNATFFTGTVLLGN